MSESAHRGGARARAEAVGQAALMWLAADPERIGRMLGEAGLDAGDLRRRAGEPEFLGFVLDFIAADEARARAFLAEEGLDPEALARARAALPGGNAPHWT